MIRLNRLRAKTLLSAFALIATFCLFLVGASIFLFWPTASASSGTPIDPVDPTRAVTAAWQRAQARGGYHFSVDVVQVTVPAATLTNVGRRSTQEQIYLEGQTELPSGSMDLRIWSDSLDNGGSILVPESGLEVQVVDGKTRTRRGTGPWEESSSLTDGYAPQGDFLAYLAAMKDVTLLGSATRHGLAYTRYGFQIDGPAFARYSRDQMQQALAARGDLPAGVQLELSPYNAAMTGDGELWVGADGLPLRQILRLRFPAERDEQLSAQIAVNFFDYAEQTSAAVTLLNAPAALGALVAPYLPGSLIMTISLAGVLLLMLYRRRRVVEVGVAVSMSLLLVLTPLLTNLPLLRFLNTQSAQAAAQAATQAEVDVARSLRAIAAESTFDPHANPMQNLAANPTGVQSAAQSAAETDTSSLTNPKCPNPNEPDSDSDGVNDCLETQVWMTNLNNPDTDVDGLSDFQEIGLGTDPRSNDSDNDGLLDKEEIAGFSLNEKLWHTDPVQMDSNGDGLSDLIERGAVENGGSARDTDGDGAPDLYDTDNDNDGVPDGTDLSPFTVAPMSSAQTPYGVNNPLQVTLNGIENGRMAYLDLQLRPVITDHLRYAYTVLDWPADRKGQVQDWDNATFAQNLVARGHIASTGAAAPADSYGDMRLTPNLEISIPGSNGADLSQYHLPAQSALAPYNINVITSTSDGTPYGTPNGVKLYVPITLVTDQRTGTRVAFSARIPYLGTGAAWTVPHQMRMVWTLQMLQDIPCDPTDDHAYASGCRTHDGSNPFLFNLAGSYAATLDSETLSDALKAAFAAAGYPLAAKTTIAALTAGAFWQVSSTDRSFVLRLKNGQISVNASTPRRHLQPIPDRPALRGRLVCDRSQRHRGAGCGREYRL